ncbi:ependymin [Capsaspora owczarzaki ATCC 30864]|uniref:Ependymin n=1 Tax=Capsaspora owczarzaki (strain ATCC 30864) TaxID=595528 RepID=A0A0D2WI10_CAPO3|nr:ependymin [Capsaspora owczarzaki ATCC 30864]KJE89395.1 ependymin [Capsaspora owczarzaki ATCC 30864]|eukprot:XP_004365744.1 ependymin [Capsaspora owczarzaki ATCC 30864]
MFKVTLAVLALACLALAQEHQRCIAPSQFESRIVEVDPSKQFELRGKLVYDAHNQRTATIEEVVVGSQKPAFYHTITLHQLGAQYNINLQTKECKIQTIPRQWRPFEIPHNSTFYGGVIVGTEAFADSGVEVDLWGGHTESGDSWTGAFTSRICIPVSDSVRGDKIGFVHTSFFDTVLGISDPNVFIPPSNCVRA